MKKGVLFFSTLILLYILILGVKSYVIGIGDQINHNELKAIASKPSEQHLFELEDYDMIEEVITKIKQQLRRADRK